MVAAGDKLERIQAYGEAWQLFADAVLIRKPCALQEWMGEDLSNTNLLVERRMRHTGSELRMARFLGVAARNAAEVTASVEDRLVGLFARSFPEITVCNKEDRLASSRATRGASYERLAQFLGSDAESIAHSFRALRPPLDTLERIVRQRATGDRPVIGIAWHSTNSRKLLPSLSDWAMLLRKLDAYYVSLQYDESRYGLHELSALSGRAVDSSQGIDQLTDLDAFAAQVASVDAVVTISNTTAHMAGALGVPCCVLLDNLQHLIWPKMGSTIPFYPETRLLRQEQREWAEVFDDAAVFLEGVEKRVRSHSF